jgi:hypothetical protein
MIDFSDHGVIHTIEKQTNEETKDWREPTKEWWVINGSSYYPTDKFTRVQAIADFQSEKSIMERADAEYRVWCD